MDKFTCTRAAVKVYDADKPRLDALWSAAMTPAEFRHAQSEDEKAADLVREAFFQDTKDVNSRDHAKLVHPDDAFVRHLIATK